MTRGSVTATTALRYRAHGADSPVGRRLLGGGHRHHVGLRRPHPPRHLPVGRATDRPDEGVTASEVAERFELHPNVARHHLDKLAGGGYLEVTVRPRRRRRRRAARRSATASPSRESALEFPVRHDDLLVTLLGKALSRLPADEAEAHGRGGRRRVRRGHGRRRPGRRRPRTVVPLGAPRRGRRPDGPRLRRPRREPRAASCASSASTARSAAPPSSTPSSAPSTGAWCGACSPPSTARRGTATEQSLAKGDGQCAVTVDHT